MQFWNQNGVNILFLVVKSIVVTSSFTFKLMKKIARWHRCWNIWHLSLKTKISPLYATKSLMGVKRTGRTIIEIKLNSVFFLSHRIYNTISVKCWLCIEQIGINCKILQTILTSNYLEVQSHVKKSPKKVSWDGKKTFL